LVAYNMIFYRCTYRTTNIFPEMAELPSAVETTT
jgi:hypothetical protein